MIIIIIIEIMIIKALCRLTKAFNLLYINLFYSIKLFCKRSLKALIKFCECTLFDNICCGYPLELPQWDASKEYKQHMFSLRNKKNISTSRLKEIPYLELCAQADLGIHCLLIRAIWSCCRLYVTQKPTRVLEYYYLILWLYRLWNIWPWIQSALTAFPMELLIWNCSTRSSCEIQYSVMSKMVPYHTCLVCSKTVVSWSWFALFAYVILSEICVRNFRTFTVVVLSIGTDWP